jgi:hypothetical protein
MNVLNPKIETISCYITFICLSIAVIAQIPSTISREAEFNENIRKNRCAKHFLAGYCKPKPLEDNKDWLALLTDTRQ